MVPADLYEISPEHETKLTVVVPVVPEKYNVELSWSFAGLNPEKSRSNLLKLQR